MGDKLIDLLKNTKALVAAGIGVVGVLVVVSGKVTDYARLPARVERLDAKIDTVANMAHDLRFLVCVQQAEEEERSTMECFQDWREAEERK